MRGAAVCPYKEKSRHESRGSGEKGRGALCFDMAGAVGLVRVRRRRGVALRCFIDRSVGRAGLLSGAVRLL